MRDQVNDKSSNKITLVVKLGKSKAKVYHFSLVLLAIISAVFFLQELNIFRYLFLIPFCMLTLHLQKVYNTQEEKVFDPELKKVALTTFLIAIMYAVISAFS